MLVVISGTNRPQSNSSRVARLCQRRLEALGQEVEVLDLVDLPPELYRPESYAAKPKSFAAWQGAIDRCEGVLTVVPEYNGSFPGALKYFVDMLAFPTSLVGMPCSFVGLSAGTWGALRAVEQLQGVYQYRNALVYPVRTFVPKVYEELGADGELQTEFVSKLLDEQLSGFCEFVRRNPRTKPGEDANS